MTNDTVIPFGISVYPINSIGVLPPSTLPNSPATSTFKIFEPTSPVTVITLHGACVNFAFNSRLEHGFFTLTEIAPLPVFSLGVPLIITDLLDALTLNPLGKFATDSISMSLSTFHVKPATVPFSNSVVPEVDNNVICLHI